MTWVWLSLVATAGFTAANFSVAMALRNGSAIAPLIFWISAFNALWFGIAGRASFFGANSRAVLLATLAAAVASAVATQSMFKAFTVSPNPGLVVAITGAQGVFIALVGILFLKQPLTVIQWTGVLMGVFALVLLGLGK